MDDAAEMQPRRVPLPSGAGVTIVPFPDHVEVSTRGQWIDIEWVDLPLVIEALRAFRLTFDAMREESG